MRKLQQYFANFANINIDEYLAFISLIIMVFVTSLGVFFRYILNAPIIWAGETIQLSFTWFIFTGMSSITKDKLHMKVDFLLIYMPNRVARIFSMIGDVILMIVLFVFVYYGWLLILLSKSNYFSILNISRAAMYAAVPVGSLLMLIRVIYNFLDEFSKPFDIFYSHKKLDNKIKKGYYQ